jgi:hypothetical protein
LAIPQGRRYEMINLGRQTNDVCLADEVKFLMVGIQQVANPRRFTSSERTAGKLKQMGPA